ncbi:TPA: ATP-binding protein [Stenotrophomonas maltophilia]|nr:ATP-binding protein [Stenotrophomonas maltophilia]
MGNTMPELTFSELQISQLFGHEAAESESIERLRDYYFKNDTYDQVTSDLPVRIVVGHKGVGKSALFAVALAEAQEEGRLAIMIRPDDILELGTDPSDFLRTIRNWKDGLVAIIGEKIATSFGDTSGAVSRSKMIGGQVLNVLATYFKDHQEAITRAKNEILAHFIEYKKVSVYIDDLDRGWQGRAQDIQRISALLNAVRDLAADNPGIHFKISLRSDVYYLVRTSDESTDKIEGSVIWHSWTNHEILVLLVKRIRTFFGEQPDDHVLAQLSQEQLGQSLERVMDPIFRGEGKWRNAPIRRVLMSLVRKRPRDMVKLLTLAAREARSGARTSITTVDFKAIFDEYSQGRIQDTVNEFRSELPEVERLLMNMKPNQKERRSGGGYLYSTSRLLEKIRGVMQQGSFKFATGKPADEKSLAAFMYKINFLIARKGSSGELITRRYFEENRYLSSGFADFGFDWEIHPAYRWALQPESLDSIFQQLDLTE